MPAIDSILQIPTPALLLDVAALDRNIRRMAQFFASGPCRLRPHFKAHKTPEVARRQLAAGSCAGLTCATVIEAEVVSSLCGDILIANETIGPDQCRRIAALARRVKVTVAVDSSEGLAQISAAATEVGVTIGVLVDVNVGQNRCGTSPGREAVELGRRVAGTAGVVLHGLMGYEGHAQNISNRANRSAAIQQSMSLLVETAGMFGAAGLSRDVVSAGGTGSYDIASQVAGVTEIQAGSYALMDTEYAGLGLPFEHAITVLGTVISRPSADRCVSNSGHKACTKDHGHPSVKGIEGASVLALNDEHATIRIPSECDVKIGDRIELLPSHIDPTMNLHDVVYAMEDGRVLGTWKIERGYRI